MLNCPIPKFDHEKILLGHGSGGVLMHQLIENVFKKEFQNPLLGQNHDSTVVDISGSKLAVTTDSYVIHPLFFPGGDIGSLAVHGTVNDLAMSGAKPLYMSVAFILEEGFPIEDLKRIAESMRKAAEESGIQIIAGDTKVVDRGKGDGVFMNTTGIGIVEHALKISPRSVQPGDVIILSGDIGRHGSAIMAQREGLQFESTIESDSASLSDMVLPLFDQGVDVHCLRDLTRGGLATALNEIAQDSGFHITIEESAIRVDDQVRGACEILGLDPLYVANEGRCIVFVPAEQAEETLSILKKNPQGAQASMIGRVSETQDGRVTLKSTLGTVRIIDMLSGEQLPRIC